jgi:hypothetical protein
VVTSGPHRPRSHLPRKKTRKAEELTTALKLIY